MMMNCQTEISIFDSTYFSSLSNKVSKLAKMIETFVLYTDKAQLQKELDINDFPASRGEL